MMSVPPIIDALVLHLDQGSAREVVELERKNDWPGMLSMAHAQLQREPGRSDWWFLQGYALSRQGRHAAAIESYREAIRLSPEEEGSWLALGVSQSELGQHEAAITTYRQALRYRPGSARAYLALADVYLGQGRADLAIPNYRESVRYDRESAQGWYGLAASYLSTGQRVRAEEAMSELDRKSVV